MNLLKVQKTLSSRMPDIIKSGDFSRELLRDESKFEGHADFAAFPENTEELSTLLKWAADKKINVTVSGERTGIAGGAAPDGGLLVSLLKMRSLSGISRNESNEAFISCGAGILLSELNEFIRTSKSGLFFPPDPTETSASIGGMIACNASGAHTFAYGPTRKYVKNITAVLVNGDIIKISRGTSEAAKDGSFIIQTADGTEIRSKVPSYPQPPTKNAAGYYSGNNIDLIDLFIGSEGTLAVISEAELILIPKPELEFNSMFFLDSEDAAVELTETLRADKSLSITAIEYFDRLALAMLRRKRIECGAASAVPPGLPELPSLSGIYIDAACKKSEAQQHANAVYQKARSLKNGTLVADWSAFDRDERERLKKFRHALPETVNTAIAERRRQNPGITKLGTDMAVPDGRLAEILAFYRHKLETCGLEYLIFGHIGNNHLHVNILPHSQDEYALGKKLYAEFATKVLEMGGSISAEHGIGKLKKNFLAMMLGNKGISEMRALKKAFDPDCRLGCGTLFQEEK